MIFVSSVITRPPKTQTTKEPKEKALRLDKIRIKGLFLLLRSEIVPFDAGGWCNANQKIQLEYLYHLYYNQKKICPFTQSIFYKTEPNLKKMKKTWKKNIRQGTNQRKRGSWKTHQDHQCLAVQGSQLKRHWMTSQSSVQVLFPVQICRFWRGEWERIQLDRGSFCFFFEIEVNQYDWFHLISDEIGSLSVDASTWQWSLRSHLELCAETSQQSAVLLPNLWKSQSQTVWDLLPSQGQASWKSW